MKRISLGLTLATSLMCTTAFGAGFEKASPWSAKWAAQGGAATAKIEGSDALFFNPAGLVKGEDKQVSLSFSPTFSTFSGPIREENEEYESDSVMIPFSGLTAKYQINPDLAVGIGAAVSGGATVEFKDIDFSEQGFTALKPDQISKIQIVEFDMGAGYRLNKNWTVGATWRATYARAKMGSIVYKPGASLVNVKLDDLEGWNLLGARFGTQYQSDDKNWGMSLFYRTKVKNELDGTNSGNAEVSAAVSGATGIPAGTSHKLSGGGDVTLKSALPQQVIVGGYKNFTDRFSMVTELVWTNYKNNEKIEISGESLYLFTQEVAMQDVELKWQDMWDFKIGGEYKFDSLAVRAGTIMTSRVTDRYNARATFTAPGFARTYIAGVGIPLMNNKAALDLGAEYTLLKGAGVNDNGLVGEFKTTAWTGHMSFSYAF